MKAKTFLLVAVLAILSAGSASAQTSFGKSSLFNDGWTFVRGDVEGADAPAGRASNSRTTGP